MYKKFDYVEGRLEGKLEVGKRYKLGISSNGYSFSYYQVCRITSVSERSEWATCYGVMSDDGKVGGLWDWPYWRFTTRIVSAEEIIE